MGMFSRISEGTSWGMHRKWRECPVCRKCGKVKLWRFEFRDRGLCAKCLSRGKSYESREKPGG